MNTHYHEIEVGFNYWYLLLPVAIIILFFLGTGRYCLTDNRIRRRGRIFTAIAIILSGVLDAVIMEAVMAESTLGLLQLLANSLAKEEDMVWAVIVLPISLIFVSAFLYGLFMTVVKLGGWMKLGMLVEFQRSRAKKSNFRDDNDDKGDKIEQPEIDAFDEGPEIPKFLRPYICNTKPIDKTSWKIVYFPKDN